MWSFGIYDLSLSESDFWRLTLTQFYALIKRFNEEQRKRDYRAAMISSIIAEANRDRKKRPRPFTPEDFMPTRKRKGRMTDEKMRTTLGAITKMLGGEEK